MIKLIALAIVTGLGAASTGCQKIESAFPTLNTIEQTVANDLAAGDSDPQIASDVCKDLGGTATTDAVCADAATVATDVIKVLEDAGALTAAAKERGKAYQVRHPAKVLPAAPTAPAAILSHGSLSAQAG